VSTHHDALSIARRRLSSFKKRWETRLEGGLDKEQEEHFRQDAEGVVELIQQAKTIAKDLKKEVPSLKIARQALGCYDFKAVVEVLYSAMAEISDLQELDSETRSDIVAHVDRIFSECKGSHGDRGKAMAKELTGDQWEAYKQARQANGGHPITQTIEQYFSNRSKAGAKKSK
jgi:hypothetical protein